MNQLRTISCQFPANSSTERHAFDGLIDLLGARILERTGCYPTIVLDPSPESFATINFGEDHRIALCDPGQKRLEGGSLLTIDEVFKRFRGHVVKVDHIGINLTDSDIPSAGMELLQFLGASTNLYAYPGGEPWYFVLPTTYNEYAGEISDFSQIRLPKFELVLDGEVPARLLQIDVTTDLSREEVEDLLPEPFGFGLPGLSDFFRSVLVNHPWPGFDMRFDFRYSGPTVNEWSTGEWLVKCGTRYNQ